MRKLALKNVQMKDFLWKEKMELNNQFLDEMDPDRVLAGFRITAGIPTDAKPYGGWEDSLIAGHGIGHFFSALAMRIANLQGEVARCADEERKQALSSALSHSQDQAEKIVSGLLACQNKTGNGFLSAATVQDENHPEIQFDALEGKCDAPTWVPWYALHKVLQGLIDLSVYTGIPGAIEAATALGDWVCDRVLSWNGEIRKRVLAVEYGGMNDSLYQLYGLLHEEKYFLAAKVFDEPDLYKELLGFKNRMRGVHANATIPKILGYLQGAAVQPSIANGEEHVKDIKDRIQVAGKFWETVLRNQTYATGGVGDMEHFFEDGMLDRSRTQCNAESCCAYNMIKLSQLLFELTGEIRYLEYIEQALWNAKLGSVGPSGGYTYFNPMATGYYRLYSPNHPKENPFWCCVGTGLEDFAKVADQVFYREENGIVIAQWISSELHTEDGIDLSLQADYEKGRITITNLSSSDNAEKVLVKVRVPRWVENRVNILSDDEEYYAVELSAGESYELDYSMKISMIGIPDETSVCGFTYGPFVLCVPLGKERWGETEGAGIQVVAPSWKVVFDTAVRTDIVYGQTRRSILDREYLRLPDKVTKEDMEEHISDYITKDENGKLFLKGLFNYKDEKVTLPLVPYYQTGDARYGIYWYLK